MSDTRMTLAMRYLDTQLRAMERAGFARPQALGVLGLTERDITQHQDRISLERLLPLFAAAEAQTGDPLIGLRTGYGFRIGSYAQTGSIYGYCENLPQVIAYNGRYQKLAIDAGEISYEMETDGHGQHRYFMQFNPYYEDHARYRHITDVIMGAYGTAYRWLSWGSGQDLLSVTLPYSEPKDTSFYDRVFMSDVTFDQPYGRLEFSKEAMEQRLTTSDPEKLALAQVKLETLLGTAAADASLDSAVRASIRACLSQGQVSVGLVAARMGLTDRGLRTKLKKAGIAYQTLLDTERQERFKQLHAEGSSFAEIAQALAYSDQPAFTKAFKRWYNMPPGRWVPSKT